jgi:hypothetical protein
MKVFSSVRELSTKIKLSQTRFGEDEFCISETKQSRGMAPRPKLFRRGDCRNKRHDPEENSMQACSQFPSR